MDWACGEYILGQPEVPQNHETIEAQPMSLRRQLKKKKKIQAFPSCKLSNVVSCRQFQKVESRERLLSFPNSLSLSSFSCKTSDRPGVCRVSFATRKKRTRLSVFAHRCWRATSSQLILSLSEPLASLPIGFASR